MGRCREGEKERSERLSHGNTYQKGHVNVVFSVSGHLLIKIGGIEGLEVLQARQQIQQGKFVLQIHLSSNRANAHLARKKRDQDADCPVIS